jgi:hypothetical protein
MDEVLKNTLTANLKAAKSPEERERAFTLAMIALCDCQYKTAQRVKSLTWKIVALALGSGTGLGALASNFKSIINFFGG